MVNKIQGMSDEELMAESPKKRNLKPLVGCLGALLVTGAVSLGVVSVISQQPALITDKSSLENNADSESAALNTTDVSNESSIPRANCTGLDELTALSDSQKSMVLTALGETLGNDKKIVFSDVVSSGGATTVVYAHIENDAQWYSVEVDEYRATVNKLTDHVDGVNDLQFAETDGDMQAVDNSDASSDDIPRNRYDTSENILLTNSDKLIGLDIPEAAAKSLAGEFDSWAKKNLLNVESQYAGVYPVDVKVNSKTAKFEIDADTGETTMVIDCTYDLKTKTFEFKQVKE